MFLFVSIQIVLVDTWYNPLIPFACLLWQVAVTLM